jgi:phage repressor protein C with HTH and peptisase S24 domain
VEIGDRLRVERLRLRLGQSDFAAKVGVSKTTQFNYETGGRAPDAVYLHTAFELGVDTHYVVTGARLVGNDDFVVIPRYDVVASAGPGAINGAELQLPGLSFSTRWLVKRGLAASNLRVVDVTGDSMTGRLNDGDQVLVNVAETIPKSGRAYVLLQGDELLVKYCQLMADGILRVSSENPHYPAYDVDLKRTEDVSIIGRVVASTHEW